MLARAFSTSPAWSRRQFEHWFPHDAPATLSRRLTRLHEQGVLERWRLSASQGSGQYVYGLSRVGTAMVLGDAVARPRGQSGWDRYHSLGISDFYLTLSASLDAAGGELIAWWGQAAAACPVDVGAASYINPDAAFLIGQRSEQLVLFEYDRAPAAAGSTQFLSKLLRYLRYYDRRSYRGHLVDDALVPILVCLFTDENRMSRIRSRCQALFTRARSLTPATLFGATAAARHPLGTVWLRPDDTHPISWLDASLQ